MKSWFAGAAALVVLSVSPAYAVDGAASPTSAVPPMGGMMGGGMGGGKDHVPYDQLTLEKAREHAHQWADKLDKMTPEEWETHKKRAMEMREKWKNISPEQRAQLKKEVQEYREKRMQSMKTEGKPSTAAPK